ncbi:hypothetical protein [Flavobacterium sp. 5]|uniref:hypothetical protein n=1 Tax=Flavobacterium sp. 5 TaxID=2035199 RepID=UPI000C2C8E01|nr:hypothetical protein [Flavobacterium sp. 5]PKB15687.1 hypothetical protein CLU82_0774 [Flavobacterium sp. 5]
MKKHILLALYFLFQFSYSQEIKYVKKGDFPDGVYMTLEDVLNMKPSSNEEVYFKNNTDSLKMPEKAFFYFKDSNKKVNYPLGVSYKGEMYFQTYRKWTNRKDRGYEPGQYSRFCRATSYGRFVYFEEDLIGTWTRALRYNVMLDGGDGKARGMVIDFEKKEMNIFRDCEDVNVFLKEHNIKELECLSKSFSIEETRQLIEELNKK